MPTGPGVRRDRAAPDRLRRARVRQPRVRLHARRSSSGSSASSPRPTGAHAALPLGQPRLHGRARLGRPARRRRADRRRGHRRQGGRPLGGDHRPDDDRRASASSARRRRCCRPSRRRATSSSPRRTSRDRAIVQAEIDRLTGLGVDEDRRREPSPGHHQRRPDVGAARRRRRRGGRRRRRAAGQPRRPAHPRRRQRDEPGGRSVPGRGRAMPTGIAVPLVTTNGNYKYVGRLDVAFDAAGETPRSRAAVPSASWSGPAPRHRPTPWCPTRRWSPRCRTRCRRASTALAATPVARHRRRVRPRRPGVRARQANAGNLVADAWLDTYDRYAAQRRPAPRGRQPGDRHPERRRHPRQRRQLPARVGVPGVISRLDCSTCCRSTTPWWS